jgi:hypothetical protein
MTSAVAHIPTNDPEEGAGVEIGVIVYGPKGEELTRVVCKPPDGEPLPYDGRMSPLGCRVVDVEWKRGPKSTDRQDQAI